MLSGGNNFPLRGNKVVMGSGYKKYRGFPQVWGGFANPNKSLLMGLGISRSRVGVGFKCHFSSSGWVWVSKKLGFGYPNPSLKQGNYLGRGNSISCFYSLSTYSQKKG